MGAMKRSLQGMRAPPGTAAAAVKITSNHLEYWRIAQTLIRLSEPRPFRDLSGVTKASLRMLGHMALPKDEHDSALNLL